MLKWHAVLMICALSMSTPALASDHEAQIKATLDAIWGGWERGDRASVENNLARDYVDTDFSGTRRSKAEVLAFFQPASGPPQNIAITRQDYRFFFHGADTAVVTYRAEDCRTDAVRGRRCFRFAAADTMVLEAGQWKLAAGQQTMLPADAPEEADISREDVLDAARRIDEAQIRNDVDAFSRLHTQDWLLTHAAGSVTSKAQFETDMATFWKPSRVSHSDRNVTLNATGAIISGIVEWEWLSPVKGIQRARERYTDVYTRRYGEWLRARSHFSCISGACA